MKILMALAVIFAAAIVGVVSYERHGWDAPPYTRLPYPVLDGLIALSVLAILGVTLSPSSGRGGTRIHLLPLSDFWEENPYREGVGPGWIAAVANFLLFIPIGFLVGIRWSFLDRWSKVLALGIGLSLAIEMVQLGLGGHDTSIDDVLLNAFGAVSGHAFMRAARRVGD